MKKIFGIFKKDWKVIHPDFTEELQKEWEKKGFGYNECKEWISVGLQPEEADLADYAARSGFKVEWLVNGDNLNGLDFLNYLKNRKNGEEDFSLSAPAYYPHGLNYKSLIVSEEGKLNTEKKKKKKNYAWFAVNLMMRFNRKIIGVDFATQSYLKKILTIELVEIKK